jgi:NAD(P)-dependent dehydrogenase (short-subunit alcohol dehydrogenase family)
MKDGKVCVITGSSSGIGAATARLFAARGWNVAINYSRETAPAEQVGVECRALGAETIVVRADVAADEDCRSFAAQVEARWGRADVLVNNAGTTRFVPARNLDGLSADDFQRVYSVNVIGAFQMTRAFEPLLRRHPVAGIVNVASVAGKAPVPGGLTSAATKAAVISMTKTLAAELGGSGIRVNAIAPGLVETPWLQQGLGAERYAATVESYKARATLAEVIAPEDVAATAWYLGVEAVKTTGEVLLLDAGLRLSKG